MKRESKFELLRIVAMLMIISSHLAAHGVMFWLNKDIRFMTWQTGSMTNKLFASAFTVSGQVGVGIFFAITGYFMLSRNSIKLTKTVLEVLFYGLFNAAFFFAAYGMGWRFADVPLRDCIVPLIASLFVPATGGIWWFVTTYIFLILFHPLLNKIIERTNRKGFAALLIITWVFWYSIGGFVEAPYFDLFKGCFFYLVGSYIRKYEIIDRVKDRKFLMLFVILLDAASFTAAEYCSVSRMSGGEQPVVKGLLTKLISASCTDIFIPVAVILVFLLFGSLNIKNSAFINGTARTVFGVYLLHDSITARSVIWHGLLHIDTVWYHSVYFPMWAVVFTALVFAVCGLMDEIRIREIEPAALRRADRMRDRITEKYLTKMA